MFARIINHKAPHQAVHAHQGPFCRTMAGSFSSWLTLSVAGHGDVSECDSGGRTNRGHVLKVFITLPRARADTLSRSAGHKEPTDTPAKSHSSCFWLFFGSPSLPPKWQLTVRLVLEPAPTPPRQKQQPGATKKKVQIAFCRTCGEED